MAQYEPLNITCIKENDKIDFNLYGLDKDLIQPLMNALRMEIHRRNNQVSFRDDREALGLGLNPKQLTLFQKKQL